MKRYNTSSGKVSNIVSYDLGNDYVIVEFNDGVRHKFSYRTATAAHVEKMKILAKNNNGLTTYIETHQPKFEIWYK